MYKQTLPLFLCIFLSACDLIDYHRMTAGSPFPNAISTTTTSRLSRQQQKDKRHDPLRPDGAIPQRSYDETEDFRKNISILKKDSIDFIIHGGDYTEFGMKKRVRVDCQYPVEARYPVCRIDR